MIKGKIKEVEEEMEQNKIDLSLKGRGIRKRL